MLRVEHLVVHAGPGEHAAQAVRRLDARRPHEHRPADVAEAPDLLDDRLPLVLLGHPHPVVVVVADDGHVRGDHHHVELVDLVELRRLRVRGPRHAGDPVVQLEVVLDGDRGHGLRLFLDGDAFLRLDRLVQTVGPLPADHFSARVLVDDDHAEFPGLVRGHHVVAVALVDGLGPDRLLEKVRQVDVLALVERAEPRLALGLLDALVGDRRLLLVELDLVVLREPIPLRLDLRQLRPEALQLLLELRNSILLAHGAYVAFGRGDVHLARLHLLIGPAPLLLRVDEPAGELAGEVVPRRVLVGGTGDDERRAGLVDEDRIHFVHDREVALRLNLLLRAELHVVAQVVEAELRGRPVHHVAVVRQLLDRRRLHVHRVDRPHREAEGPEEGERPVAIALDEVVVHGDDVNLLALEDGEIGGQRGDDRLALAGLHLRDPALVEHDRPDDLHVEGAGPERRPRLGVKLAHRLVDLDRNVHVQPARHGPGGAEQVADGLPRFRLVHLPLRALVERPDRFRQHRRIEFLRGVEDVAYADRPVHRLAGHREDLGNHVRRRLSARHALPELVGPRPELRVGRSTDLVLAGGHLVDDPQVALDQALVAGSEHLLQHAADSLYGHDSPRSGLLARG